MVQWLTARLDVHLYYTGESRTHFLQDLLSPTHLYSIVPIVARALHYSIAIAISLSHTPTTPVYAQLERVSTLVKMAQAFSATGPFNRGHASRASNLFQVTWMAQSSRCPVRYLWLSWDLIFCACESIHTGRGIPSVLRTHYHHSSRAPQHRNTSFIRTAGWLEVFIAHYSPRTISMRLLLAVSLACLIVAEIEVVEAVSGVTTFNDVRLRSWHLILCYAELVF